MNDYPTYRRLVDTVKVLTDIIVCGMSRPEARPLSGNTETVCTVSCMENNRKKKHGRRELTEHEGNKRLNTVAPRSKA
jgi:hypothetical protein